MIYNWHMTFQVLAVFLAIVLTSSSGTPIPAGFILDVDVQCGTTVAANTPRLVVTSDMHLQATAKCANGDKTLNTTNQAEYSIAGTFDSNVTGCLFYRRSKSNVYTVDLSIAYGLVGSTIQKEAQFYTLTCTFDQNGKEKTSPVKVTRGYIAPVELRVDAGNKTSSTIALNVVDVRGATITVPIIRGRKIALSATSDGQDGEKGLRPTACDAIDPSTSQRLPMLRAGCGTGLVMPLNWGFTTVGNTTTSNYFPAVQVEDKRYMTFECTFSLCDKACDGNSCTVSTRKKRSTDPEAARIGGISTTSLELIEWPEDE